MDSRYGRLIVPASVVVLTFEDGEFGTLCTIKKPTYLYSAISPPKSIIKAAKSPLPKVKTFPHFLMSGTEQVAVCRELKAKEEILARRVRGHKELYEMVTFEKAGEVVEDMPETGDGIKITSKGYVLAKDVKYTAKVATFKTRYVPIFANKDLISDVHQNSFGDCFLLAGVLGILAKNDGSDYIRSMMIQDGDYTVVRLHDPITSQPLYVRVKNSVYVEDGEVVINHKALWVHALEKAYTAIAFRKINNQVTATFPAFREVFGNGGNPALALTILTGQSAERQQIAQSKVEIPWEISDWEICRKVYKGTRYVFENLSAETVEKLDALLEMKDKKTKDILSSELVKELLEKTDEEDKEKLLQGLRDYIGIYRQMAGKEYLLLKDVFKNLRQIAVAGKYIYGLRPYEEEPENNGEMLAQFYELIKPVNGLAEANSYFKALEKMGAPEEVVRCYKEYVFQKHRWNLVPEAGVCTEEVDALFEKLKKMYDDKNISQVMVVSTHTKLPDDKASKDCGLRPQHAYAVTGVFEKKVENGATLKMVRVRNPWGHIGGQYYYEDSAVRRAQGQSIAKEVENPETEIPMADFVKYFNAYSSGAFAPAPTLTPQQEIALYDQSVANDAAIANSSFLNRHWGKMLIGAGVVTALVILGVLTLGVGSVIVGAVAALVSFLSAPVVAGLCGFVMTAVAAAFGAGCGALVGAGRDCATSVTSTSSYTQLDIQRRLGVDGESISTASTSSSEEPSLEENLSEQPYAKNSEYSILDATQAERESYASTGTDQANPGPGC